MDKSHVEAWKAVTEFTKVIITLSTSILTLLIGYIAFNNIELSFTNLLPAFLLVLAIALSLFGFGRAIPAIKTGDSKPVSVLFSNLSALFLIIGILTIPIVSINPKLSAYKVIALKGLNVRIAPDINSDIVKVLDKDEIVIAISLYDDWVKVDTDGNNKQDGYCSKKYLALIN